MDLELSISWCERVSEWILLAQELSAISPSKDDLLPAKAKSAASIIACTATNFFILIPQSQGLVLLSDYNFHAHALVLFAADHGAYDFVFAGLGRGEHEFLHPGLEQQVPAGDARAVLGAQQEEAVNGAVAVQALRLAGGDAQPDFLARLQREHGLRLAGNFVPAVAVGEDLDQAGIAECRLDEQQHGRGNLEHGEMA